jgi:glucose-6-phosphate 1-dehydrogenase
MVPNHLFQLVAMTAMEPPISFAADAIRNKKSDLFTAIRPIAPKDVVRGQYATGLVGDGRVAAYRAEDGVSPSSNVETFVALKLWIDNWRWADVPFYLRTGKRLAKRKTEISIHFKRAPHALFREHGIAAPDVNWLVLHIQPDEGICLSFNAKKPGPSLVMEKVALDFRYSDWFDAAPAVGYETLIYDCLIGDATLFQRADQIEGAWTAVEPVLHAWAEAPPDDFPNYAPGSEGPPKADALLERDGRAWRPLG